MVRHLWAHAFDASRRVCTLTVAPPPPGRAGASAAELPHGIEETLVYLQEALPESRSALDAGAGGRPEGLVLRALHRSGCLLGDRQGALRALRAHR